MHGLSHIHTHVPRIAAPTACMGCRMHTHVQGIAAPIACMGCYKHTHVQGIAAPTACMGCYIHTHVQRISAPTHCMGCHIHTHVQRIAAPTHCMGNNTFVTSYVVLELLLNNSLYHITFVFYPFLKIAWPVKTGDLVMIKSKSKILFRNITRLKLSSVEL